MDEGNQISVDLLVLFGLLHCQGKAIDKTAHLYNILQEGGVEKHDFISACDKDFPPTFEKLCAFATYDLFEQAEKLGHCKKIYDEQEIAQLKEKIEVIREDQFLEDVYGFKSKLPNDDWL